MSKITARAFAKLRKRLAISRDASLRADIRRLDRPIDRYAAWCAERAGIALPYTSERGWRGRAAGLPLFKLMYVNTDDTGPLPWKQASWASLAECAARRGSPDAVAVFYTGEPPRFLGSRGWGNDNRRELGRVIVPNAFWQGGPVEETTEPETLAIAA